jgi:Tfp pilus assembly PilM family ATPase
MRPDKLVSVSISEKSIDFIEILRKKNENLLLSYGSYDLDLSNLDELDDILHMLSQTVKKPYYTGIALIHGDTLRLNMVLNKTNDLKSAVLQNIKKTYDIKLSEYYLDFTSQDLGNNKVVVFASAISKEIMDPIFDIFKKYHFKLLFMEPAIISSLRALSNDVDYDVFLHLHLDYHRSAITILDNGMIHAIRYINLGFEDMIDWLADAGGISKKQAEELFLTQGIKKVEESDELKQNIRNNIIDIIDKLSLEIQRTIDYYSMTYKKSPVKNFIISGIPKIIPNYADYLSKLFSVSVSLENTEKLITIKSEDIPDLSKLKFPFICIGAAIR